jgi:lycopene cyclase domain-containing protein
MDYLYLLLNLGSISIPFLFSFHPKLKFYRYWKALFLSIGITMIVFIPWDIIFTQNGFWGFNDFYYLDYKIFDLPLEEWMFFICIPYACVFTHYAILSYFPKLTLKFKTTLIISILLLVILSLVLIFNHDKWYTLINYLYAIILLPIVLKINFNLLRSYYLTFMVMLIPFFIVNGVLTGSFIENEIVWYNNHQNLGIRIFTIPIEDTIYAFTLILTNLFLVEYFMNLYDKKRKSFNQFL